MHKKAALIIFASLVLFGFGCNRSVTPPAPVGEIPSTPTMPEPTSEPTFNADGYETVSTGELHVRWSTPTMIAPVDIFSDAYKGEGQFGADSSKTDYLNASNYHQVGVVQDGPYAGGTVAIVNAVLRCTMGGYNAPYHVILPKAGGKPILLAAISPSYKDETGGDPGCKTLEPNKLVVDTTASAPELFLPEKFTYGTAQLQIVSEGTFYANALQIGTQFFDPANKTLMFADTAVGKLYKDAATVEYPQYGFYAVAPDGTARHYAIVAPFYDADLHIPAITWKDGTKNTKEYWMTKMGGCGSQNYANVIKNVTLADLQEAGMSSKGDYIYVLKNSNHPILKAIYEAYAPTYEGRDTSNDVSYADFIKSRPMFFWFDPFGRLIGFQGTQYLPAAECGKPVIYLYPEKTTDVSVQLAPQGGFTKSEPAYDGGWSVRATPKSELTNLKDGKTYPYLFWEGRGGLYETPKQGFVVAQKDVHGFLIEKLSAFGLNAQERADFLEFWEPRMTGSPYYFVTFLGNRAMDALAPMNVTPKPDTIIRVLMDFQPLEKPVPVQSYEIHTPARRGFTVVEWGGVLR